MALHSRQDTQPDEKMLHQVAGEVRMALDAYNAAVERIKALRREV